MVTAVCTGGPPAGVTPQAAGLSPATAGAGT